MTVHIINKRNLDNIIPNVFARMQNAAGDVLENDLKPQEPIDTGAMKNATGTETRVDGKKVVSSFFVGREVDYAWYPEHPEDGRGGYHPRTPGTRMPWLRPGVREGMPKIVEAVKQGIVAGLKAG